MTLFSGFNHKNWKVAYAYPRWIRTTIREFGMFNLLLSDLLIKIKIGILS